jgi:hypothetical protein
VSESRLIREEAEEMLSVGLGYVGEGRRTTETALAHYAHKHPQELPALLAKLQAWREAQRLAEERLTELAEALGFEVDG